MEIVEWAMVIALMLAGVLWPVAMVRKELVEQRRSTKAAKKKRHTPRHRGDSAPVAWARELLG